MARWRRTSSVLSLTFASLVVFVATGAGSAVAQADAPAADAPAADAPAADAPAADAPAADAPAADAPPVDVPEDAPDDASEDATDDASAVAEPHFHGEALHAHVDGEVDHHHHGGRLTHDHVEGDAWHHHHGDVAHDHNGTDRTHHHHGKKGEDVEGHDHERADNEHDHLAETLCPKDVPCVAGGDFAMWPRARLIAGYEFVQPDANFLFVGQNDGFLLEQARIGLQGVWRDRLGFTITYDAITLLPSDDVNQPLQDIAAGVRDAFLYYQPIAPLKIWLGQIYMPADIEGQTSRADLNFTARSVASGGVRAGRGFEQSGLSVIRETGLVVGNDDFVPFSIGKNAIGFDYRLAVANGNGSNIFGNDNKLPAVFARGGARYGDYLKVGLGGTYNPRTEGEQPNLYLETESRGFADVTFDMFGFRAVASGIFEWTTFDSLLPEADPARTQSAYGVTAWVSVEDPFGFSTYGVRPAFRVSYYEPNSALTDDQLLETTFAVRYIPTTGLPMALLFDVSLLFEPGPANQRQIDNHRATALVVFNL